MEQHITFYIFATIAVIAAIMVILSKNPVRAVLNLILTFFATAMTWLCFDAEFLAITLILVYVGAVMVLFLFVVMMLDINYAALHARLNRRLPICLTVIAGIFAIVCNVLNSMQFSAQAKQSLAYNEIGNTTLLGKLVFTDYLLHFEIAGVLLLVAIIAAIALIHRGPRSRKVQNISKQVNVRPEHRVILVDGT